MAKADDNSVLSQQEATLTTPLLLLNMVILKKMTERDRL